MKTGILESKTLNLRLIVSTSVCCIEKLLTKINIWNVQMWSSFEMQYKLLLSVTH